MVRTKTRPRTFSECYPNGPPPPVHILLPKRPPEEHYNVPFKDHKGRPALMSWQRAGPCLLPPLASWVFYLVHPDVPRDFDGCQFDTDFVDHSPTRGIPFRYEFFFLPGATAEECVAHYRGEMEARGTIWPQIVKVKAAIRHHKQQNGEDLHDEYDLYADLIEEPSDLGQDASRRLPGLVWVRQEDDSHETSHRGWFFLYPDAELKLKGADGEARLIDHVFFDPFITSSCTEEDLVRWNPMDHPIYVERRTARDKEECGGIVDWMEETMALDLWAKQASQATHDALELGWDSW